MRTSAGPAVPFGLPRDPRRCRKRPTGLRTVLIVAFPARGIPRRHTRYRWRTTAYRMHRSKINILPGFRHAFAALCTNRNFTRRPELRMVRRHRLYLLAYFGRLGWIPWLG